MFYLQLIYEINNKNRRNFFKYAKEIEFLIKMNKIIILTIYS